MMMIESNEQLREEQTALLKDFIAFKITTDEFQAQDKLHFITDNDYYDDLVMLTRKDIISVLERYLKGAPPLHGITLLGCSDRSSGNDCI